MLKGLFNLLRQDALKQTIADAQTKLTEDSEYRQKIYDRLINEVRPNIEKTRKYKF